MSGWDAYITSLTDRSSAIKRAAIVGLDGAVWAKTANFNPTPDEIKKFSTLFGDLSSVPGLGADLEGIHYIVPRTEPGLIFGKKDKSGFFAVQSKSAIIIGIFEGDNEVSGNVRCAVQAIADYLSNLGY